MERKSARKEIHKKNLPKPGGYYQLQDHNKHAECNQDSPDYCFGGHCFPKNQKGKHHADDNTEFVNRDNPGSIAELQRFKIE